MKHALVPVFVVSVLLASAPAFAQAKADPKPNPDKPLMAYGTAIAVTADSLSVRGKSGVYAFVVDKTTRVSAPGATHKTAAMKEEKKPTVITEFVKVGDEVAVGYHDLGGTRHAASVTVRNSKPIIKK
jgi:hypothetical protein